MISGVKESPPDPRVFKINDNLILPGDFQTPHKRDGTIPWLHREQQPLEEKYGWLPNQIAWSDLHASSNKIPADQVFRDLKLTERTI